MSVAGRLRGCLTAIVVGATLVAVLWVPSFRAWGHGAGATEHLPLIGDAPEFTLVDQNGAPFALRDFRGKVVAVTFIYAKCADTCPLLTAKMASLQTRLGPDFGSRVRFVSITVDPETDTPAALRAYAIAHGANAAGWSFLTGTRSGIQDVVRRYGAFAKLTERGDIDHLVLTSLIDRQGRMRVQYLGYRFKPDQMLHDLQALLRE